jgi:hypothetical protein
VTIEVTPRKARKVDVLELTLPGRELYRLVTPTPDAVYLQKIKNYFCRFSRVRDEHGVVLQPTLRPRWGSDVDEEDA